MRPNRLARWTFRLGVAVCVLIVVVTVASFWWSAGVVCRGWVFDLDFGSLSVFDLRSYGPLPDSWGIHSVKRSVFLLWPKTGIFGLDKTAIVFPTWMFLLAALIPTVLAWRRLRRPLPGHCRKCGYDLTGNVTGVCSECGEEIMENEK